MLIQLWFTFQGCILKGARLVCANLEGCILRRCDMEAGAKYFTNLESANLKGAELEGSLMGGVNLRVATLKNANMQNCYLRLADLAGADLEVEKNNLIQLFIV